MSDPTQPVKPPQVYAAIVKVMTEIGRSGIAKGRKNAQQGYTFRGIDDVYNELNALLSAAQLVILPCVQSRIVTERETKAGGVLFYVVLEVGFTFVSAEDGSTAYVQAYGEAMDSGDKATNKAMSAAYKYACMEVFCIPTEGTPDADAETHEVTVIPQIPVDVKIVLDDSAKVGLTQVKEQWALLNKETRELITVNHGPYWAKIKKDAAAADARKEAAK